MAKLNQKTFLEDFSALNATEQKNALRELNVNLHQRITQMNGLDASAITPKMKERIEKEYGEKISQENIDQFCTLAKKVTADEFASMVVDGNLPTVKLNNAEMALISGGTWLQWGCSGACVIIGVWATGITSAVGGLACGAIYEMVADTGGSGKGTAATKK